MQYYEDIEVGRKQVEFERPGDEDLTWELDDMHWPFADTAFTAFTVVPARATVDMANKPRATCPP